MPTPKLSRALAKEAADALKKHGKHAYAARALGIPGATFDKRLQRAIEYGMITADLPPRKDGPVKPDEEALRDKIAELEVAVKSARANTLTDDYVKRKIIGLTESMAEVEPPKWALKIPKERGLPGVPVAMWSDWHAGETVDPGQINGVNSFDMQIMNARARRLVERTIMLLTRYIVNPQYPGFVCNLGGDMLTGDIHEELTATNDGATLVALLDLYGVLRWCITQLADQFGNVFLPCVPGNHGRLTKKPRCKERAFTNLDWLLYQFLARSFENDPRVTFMIPDGPDALYRVYGHRYLLTHGDQFRGGDGIIGAIGPITRGNQKKSFRNSAIQMPYDTMVLGHWHQYMPLHRTIVNGSLKGYDEYASQYNFGYEPPIQATWLSHYEHGITQHLPIYLEPHAGRAQSSEWVSWKSAA